VLRLKLRSSPSGVVHFREVSARVMNPRSAALTRSSTASETTV
jgi:hypothetical protein